MNQNTIISKVHRNSHFQSKPNHQMFYFQEIKRKEREGLHLLDMIPMNETDSFLIEFSDDNIYVI